MATPSLAPADIAAMSSVFVAICALVVSLWQGHIMRKHNRLSSKPVIDMNLHVTTQKVCLEILNCGLGPGFLQALDVSHGGTTYNLMDEVSLQRYFEGVAPRSLGVNPTLGQHNFNAVIPVGTISIMEVPGAFKINVPQHVSQTIRGARFSIKYKCIYGVEYTATHTF